MSIVYDWKVNIDDNELEEICSFLEKGELVVFPTETVYGLGGNALDPSCVAKIYAAKGRPADNPLIVHISKVDDIYPLVAEFSESNKRLVERFMPGPFNFAFPKK